MYAVSCGMHVIVQGIPYEYVAIFLFDACFIGDTLYAHIFVIYIIHNLHDSYFYRTFFFVLSIYLLLKVEIK